MTTFMKFYGGDHFGFRCSGRAKKYFGKNGPKSSRTHQKPKGRKKAPVAPDPAMLSSFAAFLQAYKSASDKPT